jgi:hypothetical protein
VRRKLPPQIPLLKAHLEAQSRWRRQIWLGTMEKGLGKALTTSEKATKNVISKWKRWLEVSLTNNAPQQLQFCAMSSQAHLLDTRFHHDAS